MLVRFFGFVSESIENLLNVCDMKMVHKLKLVKCFSHHVKILIRKGLDTIVKLCKR